MSWNFKDVMEKLWKMGTVREMSGKNSVRELRGFNVPRNIV